MDYRMARDLDNYITGHYGEDQIIDHADEDEGYGILESAAAYLSRDDYPDWDVSDALDVIRAYQFDIEEDIREAVMYQGNLISGLVAMVDRAFAEQNPECTLVDEVGAECGCAAVILLLPSGDESRCLRHLGKGPQA